MAFKPGTDDVRGAPPIALGEALHRAGVHVRGTDPRAGDAARTTAPWLEVIEDPYRAAEGAHCLVLCTEWPEFGSLDLDRLRRAMLQPAIVDARNALPAAEMTAAGFLYLGVGASARSMQPHEVLV